MLGGSFDSNRRYVQFVVIILQYGILLLISPFGLDKSAPINEVIVLAGCFFYQFFVTNCFDNTTCVCSYPVSGDTKRSWWSRRSVLELRLLVLAIVLLVVTVAMVIVVAITSAALAKSREYICTGSSLFSSGMSGQVQPGSGWARRDRGWSRGWARRGSGWSRRDTIFIYDALYPNME